MGHAPLDVFVRRLRHVACQDEDRTDAELLGAYAHKEDQAAFAVLLRRHGPGVLNACRRILHHEQDAEDVFQATFLVLAAKARSIRVKSTLAGFLHGVAYHLALKARREAARRRRREQPTSAPPARDLAAELSWREVQRTLEEEIQRLPDKLRTPFILCHIEGLSRAETGRQLGIKEGTVWSRLAAARARLQARLGRRGVELSAVLAAVAMSAATVRAGLTETVLEAVRRGLAGSLAAGIVSARVGLLARTGLGMLSCKARLALAGLALLVAVGTATALVPAFKAEAVPAAPPPAQGTAGEQEARPAHTDRHGDPLPAGAIARLGTVRWRHGYLIHALAYSPDGKRIAVAGGGRAITLWDVATGKEVYQFPNGTQPLGVAFSPDGQILANTGTPCHLWHVATGRELRQLKGHQNGTRRIAFTPDGKSVATVGYEDPHVRFWDPATGAEQRRLDCRQGDLSTFAFSPDGRLLASAGRDGSIRLWDLRTGKARGRLAGHTKDVWSLVFSAGGQRLASAAEDGTIRLWNPATGRQLRLLGNGPGFRDPLAFSPDGSVLASGHPGGMIRLWDAAAGEEKRHWQAGALGVDALAFSPDGGTLASGGNWDSIHLWDVASGRERQPTEGHSGLVDFVRFSADGRELFSIGRDQSLLRWDLIRCAARHEASWSGSGYGVSALSPDGSTLAVGSWRDHDVRLWDVRSGKAVRQLGQFSSFARAVVFSPDGQLVAAGASAGPIRIWRVQDGREVRQIEGVVETIKTLSFTPDSKGLACVRGVDGEQTLRLVDVTTGKERCRSEARYLVYGPLVVSPDGGTVASGHGLIGKSGPEEPVVILWDATTGRERCRHFGHRDGIGAIAFSPDGKCVASGAGNSGDRDNSVHVWEAATGRLIRRFDGHHSCVASLAFSADGRTLASGAGDSTVLLWDVTGGRTNGPRQALTPRRLNACWTALQNEGASEAYDAVWTLVAGPEQAIPFLSEHLRPAVAPEAKVVARLLAELDGKEFALRQRATADLAHFGDTIVPALRRALEGQPSPELRRRVEDLLGQATGWTPERLRTHRAIQALEHIGTSEARRLLDALAAGAPGSQPTEEAKTSLQRMRR
jgi:RNA polymerase sigma factor (sigma-70 family)